MAPVNPFRRLFSEPDTTRQDETRRDGRHYCIAATTQDWTLTKRKIAIFFLSSPACLPLGQCLSRSATGNPICLRPLGLDTLHPLEATPPVSCRGSCTCSTELVGRTLPKRQRQREPRRPANHARQPVQPSQASAAQCSRSSTITTALSGLSRALHLSSDEVISPSPSKPSWPRPRRSWHSSWAPPNTAHTLPGDAVANPRPHNR